MNWHTIFYWMTVADNARLLFLTVVTIFMIISVVVTMWFLVTDDTDNEKVTLRKWIFWCYPITILSWCFLIFTPSKRDTLLIIAGGGTMNFLTTDSTAKQIPHELSTFVVTELKNMAAEAKVDLGIASQKDKLLDEAKNMSAVQLMEKMKVDSNFAKVILNK